MVIVQGILYVAVVIALVVISAFVAAVLDYHNSKHFSCETPKNPPPPPRPSPIAKPDSAESAQAGGKG